MKHLKSINEFFSFNEKHVYHKAIAHGSKSWETNFKKLLNYIESSISKNLIKDFNKDGETISFKIQIGDKDKGKRVKLTNTKISLYKKDRNETEVALDLTKEDHSKLMDALKKRKHI